MQFWGQPGHSPIHQTQTIKFVNLNKYKRLRTPTIESSLAIARMRGQVALALSESHAVLGPSGTLVVLTLVALVALVEEAFARVVGSAVT